MAGDVLTTAQRVREAVGTNALTAAYWASAVTAADALAELQQLDAALYESAASVGITPEQWAAIKRGSGPDETA